MNGITGFFTALRPGDHLGRYVILSEIGKGGMAVVYKAHQPDLDRVVAIKVLFGDAMQARFIERFQGEARAVARMSHPNVIKIYEVGEEKGIHFLVMEYVEGMDLLAFLHQNKPSFGEVVEIVRQAAEALAYCHQQGIIHRDLKPTNILMKGTVPILIDFGLAKAADPLLAASLTLSGEVVGSPAYMSPEQAMGQQVDTSSDLCSLGIIMYELISFKNPYLDPRSLHQTALNAIRAEPVSLRVLVPWLDEDFAALVEKCMAKEPKDRYASLEPLLKDLYAYQHGLPVSAKPPSALSLAWRFVKANPTLYIGAAFLLMAAGLTALFLNIMEGNKKAPWGLVQEEYFDAESGAVRFSSFDWDGKGWVPSESWKTAQGRLEVFAEGFSCAVSNQELFGDVRIEFRVKGLNGCNNDFNAFLFGPSPDEAFRFTVAEWGGNAASIESGPLGRRPFSPKPVSLEPGRVYQVTLEKEGGLLRLLLDGKEVARRHHPLPIKVDHGSRFGFHTWKSNFAVDDLRIYKKAVALAASPTVVADAYLQEGFINQSLLAYRHVIETYPGKNVTQEAQLKLGKCQMVLGDFGKAVTHLTYAATEGRDPDLVPEALFHLAQCYFGMGRRPEAFAKLRLLPQNYPESGFNDILIDERMESVHRCLDTAKAPALCAARLEEEIRFLIENEDPRRGRWGALYAGLLDRFRAAGQGQPVQASLKYLSYFSDHPAVVDGLRLVQWRHALGTGELSPEAREGADSLAAAFGRLGPALAPEFLFVQSQRFFLAGDFAKARESLDRIWSAYRERPGISFRALVQDAVLREKEKASPGAKSGREAPAAAPFWEKALSETFLSRRERMQVQIWAGRLPADSSWTPPFSEPASWEEDFLTRGGTKRFAPQTLEHRYGLAASGLPQPVMARHP